MRTIQFLRSAGLAAVVGACVLVAGMARADVTTERPGSILIFPKVVRDGTRDTVIQLTNTGNMPENVRCFYLNGSTAPNGQPLCNETDFFLFLTKQQPTYWSVTDGRSIFNSPSPGIIPGLIPPAPAGFTGALVCVETDPSGKPMFFNALKGEATIENVLDDSVAPGGSLGTYNAIAVQGGQNNDTDNVLDLNNSEYNACPASSILDFAAAGGPDPVIEALGNGGTCGNTGLPCNSTSQCTGVCSAGVCSNGAPGACTSDADCSLTCNTGQSAVQTTLTVLPCNLDLNHSVPTTLALSFAISDELEVRSSASTTISCWGSFPISDIAAMRAGTLATPYGTARITSASGGPFLAVAETFRSDSAANTASSIVNLQTQGICNGSSNPPLGCNSDADCPMSNLPCQLTYPATIRLADH